MDQSISQALNSKTKENLFIKLFQQKIMERSNLNCEEERKIEIETTNASEKCQKKIQNKEEFKDGHEDIQSLEQSKTDMSNISSKIKEKIVAKIKNFKNQNSVANVENHISKQSQTALVENQQQKTELYDNNEIDQSSSPIYEEFQVLDKNQNQIQAGQIQSIEKEYQKNPEQELNNSQVQQKNASSYENKQQGNPQQTIQDHIQNHQEKFVQTETYDQSQANAQVFNLNAQSQKQGQNQSTPNKGIVMQQEISYQKQDANLEIEEVILIVDTIKIVSRFTKDLDNDVNSSLVFQLQPIYEIQSILQKQGNQEEISDAQIDRSTSTDDKGSIVNQPHYFYRQILPVGCLLTAKYSSATLPTELSILFQKVEDMFISIKNHQSNLFNLEQLGQKMLLINIPIFQKTKRFKIPLHTSPITKQQFLQRKNSQLVDQMKLLYKKYKVSRRKYKILKTQYKKVDHFRLQLERLRQNKNAKLIAMQKQMIRTHHQSGLPPIELQYTNRERPLADGQEALQQQEQQKLLSGNSNSKSQKGKGAMYTRKQVKKGGYY